MIGSRYINYFINGIVDFEIKHKIVKKVYDKTFVKVTVSKQMYTNHHKKSLLSTSIFLHVVKLETRLNTLPIYISGDVFEEGNGTKSRVD